MRSHPRPRFHWGSVAIRSRGRLPHWEAEDATYFVTFRLVDSLPASVLDAYRFEREDIVRTAEAMGRKLTATEIARLDKLHGEKVESFLDSGAGSCYLADTRVARIVRDNLLHFDGVKYRLVAWCVMPNHVHLVLTPLSGHGLASILHSWKSYTAKKANRLLNRNGEFWQREYYDRLIRDEAEYHHAVNYVLDNPRKAGLLNWPWVDVCGNADE